MHQWGSGADCSAAASSGAFARRRSGDRRRARRAIYQEQWARLCRPLLPHAGLALAGCESLKGRGLAQYAWLTNSTAWAGTMNYADWNIRQGRPYATLGFINHDSNEARDDYGGFRLAGM
jgi:hypothetical protein